MRVVAENYEQTHTDTHTRDNYSNARCAHARRGLIKNRRGHNFIGVAMQPEALIAATLAVSQE